MMKKLTTIIVATGLWLASASGCAMTPNSYQYKADHSRAYNLAEAGGLITGIKDAAVPRDQLERMTDTKTFGAAYVMSGYIAPSVGGLSNWQGGVVNMANWAFGPKQHSARNSLIAWMPVNEAVSSADAQTKLISHVKLSIESSLTELGVKFDLLYDKDGNLTYHFYSNEWDCPTWTNGKSKVSDMCSIKVRIVEPNQDKAPAFITGVQGDAYAFTSGHDTDFNFINVTNGAASHAPEQAVYSKISEKLPVWAFLYLAPQQVKMNNSDKIVFPYLLEQGKPELFVYPF